MNQRRATLVPFLFSMLACTSRETPSSPTAEAGDPATESDSAWTGDDAVVDDATPDGASLGDDGMVEAATGPPFDAGADGICAQPLGLGDLVIEEMMIESVSGSGDNGEWLEIASTLDCAINLAGLHLDCPHGYKVATCDVGGDLWIPARGRIVVADALDPALNHSLPGTVLAWSSVHGDVLRNSGGTVDVWMHGTLVDSVTWPSEKWTIGASVAFPSDCDASARSDFSGWQTSAASWFPAFFGTPNAANTDVHCR
jgi:hypothetical protein